MPTATTRSTVALSGLLAVACGVAEARDAWRQPFSSDSIWNTAIGSDAVYVDAGMPTPRNVGHDIEHLHKTTSRDPVVPVYTPSGWSKRLPGKRQEGEVRVPRRMVIKDADPPHTPNSCSVLLMPDRRTIHQLSPTVRHRGADRIVGYISRNVDIYGKGPHGAHYGSGLSVLGGSIRKGELTSRKPILHVIKLNVWCKHVYYGDDRKGFRWPARMSDSYAAKRYAGKNRALVMGALVCLRPSLRPADLDVRTEVGLKIFYALQDYGAYIAEDSAWDAADLCVERGVPEQVEKRYRYRMRGSSGPYIDEMKRMVTALAIVDNNGPDSVGGGGTPRRPPLPELKPPRPR